MDRLLRLLQKRGIPSKISKKVLGKFESVKLSKKEFWLRRGELCNKIAFIESGYVMGYYELNKKKVISSISPSGKFITDLQAYKEDKAANMNVMALTSCEILAIRKSDIDDLLTTNPELYRLVVDLYEDLLIEMEIRIVEYSSMTAEERLKSFLGRFKGIDNIIQLSHVADYLGISAETLSRIRAKR